MEILIPLERTLQQLDLALALDALGLRVLPALLVAVGLVELGHLIDRLLVLHLDLQLELELVQHLADLGRGQRRVGLDQVELGVVRLSIWPA